MAICQLALGRITVANASAESKVACCPQNNSPFSPKPFLPRIATSKSFRNVSTKVSPSKASISIKTVAKPQKVSLLVIGSRKYIGRLAMTALPP